MKIIDTVIAFCNKKAFKIGCVVVACLAGLLAVYSFVKTPFTGDIKVFMAAANQAKYQDSGWLMSIFEAWELKGIASRFLMYIIYLVADLMVGFENKLVFEAACKLVYAVFIIALIGLAAYVMPVDNKKRALLFGISFFAFFATGTAVQMQVEMTCIAISLLAAACLIRGTRISVIACGFLGATLFLFKSIFVLLFVSVLLGGAVFNLAAGKRVTRRSVIGAVIVFVVFLLLFVASIYLIYPQEFADMAQAAEYQSTMLSEDSNVSLQSVSGRLGLNFTLSMVMIPILIIGLIGSIYAVIRALREKNHPLWISLVGMWLVSLDLIIVSNMYFIYHYFLLVFPALVGTFLYFRYLPSCRVLSVGAAALSVAAVIGFNILLGKDYEIVAINNSTALMVLLHLVIAALILFIIGRYKKTQAVFSFVTLTVCFFLWANFLSALAPYYKSLRTFDKYSYIYSQRDIPADIGEDEVLFLDSGAAAFYIDAPSYSRYFFNLPLQRWTENDEWEWKDKEYENILAYDGKYVIIDYGWFKLDSHPELKQKLADEYTALETENLRVWTPHWEWYNLRDFEKFVDNEEYGTGLRILVRK